MAARPDLPSAGRECLRALRRERARVRHHRTADAAALDQLPRQQGAARDRVEHRRRLQLLPRRQAAPADALPLRQRAARQRRQVPLHRRRRRRPGTRASGRRARRSTATSAGTASVTRASCRRRNGLAADLLVFVADDENAEFQVLTLNNDSRRAEDRARLLVRRVVPVECRGRRHQPAAQPLARGMPGQRLDDLPRHRLPRAARPLRLPPRESRRGRLRHRPQRFPRPLRRLRRSGRRARAPLGQFLRQRLVADRVALACPSRCSRANPPSSSSRPASPRTRVQRQVGERRPAQRRRRAPARSAAA